MMNEERKNVLASRLGVSMKELEQSLSRIFIDDCNEMREVKGENGERAVLLRFPGGYRRVSLLPGVDYFC